jgi:pre-mRNA-splicing factor ISY1
MTSSNEEKAHAMLNRWVAMKKELNSRSKDKRPNLSSECNNLQECERWKNQIIKEITKKVADIQNASLGEYKIRELNDEINKLFREKGHWEERIKDLGGPDYKKLAPKALDAEGFELPGSGGYRYWGAAKDLPGVRELFAKEIPHAPKKSRVDLYKNINFEYYGFNKNDEELINQEKEAEDLLMQEYLLELQEKEYENARKKQRINSDENILLTKESYIIKKEEYNQEEFLRFKILHTPDGQNMELKLKQNDDEIEKLILEKKKKQLIKLLNLDEVENLTKESQEILKENKIVFQNLQSNMNENEI